ncbi:MAG TPA: corrinoid protein [Bacteroidales bacterium]|nr:corrinoid protein [Bacteroidales bacterium]
MSTTLGKLAACVEAGKLNRTSPYPPSMKDMDGADELTRMALEEGIPPSEILESALIPAMTVIGNRFSRQEIFVPQMLMSARAMSCSMVHLKPYFVSGEAKRKGTVIIGTVLGDLHDIGKNLVAMMIEGGGWEVIDLGVDAGPDRFLKSLGEHPGAAIGLSAMLTTTMENMKLIVEKVRESCPATKIMVGGAPVNRDFCNLIGADFYSPDPQGAVNYLNSIQ